MKEISNTCEGKVVDLIASGYDERVLPYAWLALVSGLANIEVATEEPGLIPPSFERDTSLDATKVVLEEVNRNLRDYWKCLS